MSDINASLEWKGVRQWEYRLDNGTVMAIGYFPEEAPYGQPAKNMIFISRGEGGKLLRGEIDEAADATD